MHRPLRAHANTLNLRNSLLVALPLTFLAATSHAQSSLQIYGLVDAGWTHVTNVKGTGTLQQISSGVMEGSRLGFKGTEDLGGGYKTVFALESRFESNTGGLGNKPLSGNQLPDHFTAPGLGLTSSNPELSAAYAGGVSAVNGLLTSGLGVNTSNNLFDRQAYVGLVTPVGAVLAGRQYTPAYEIVGTFDSMHSESALAAGQIAAFPTTIDIRLSNTVQYRVQQGGWSAALMYGTSDTATPARKRFYGANLIYKGSGFALGAGYNTRQNELDQKALTNTSLGASVELGPGTLSALYARNEDAHPAGLSGISSALIAANPALTPVAANIQNAYINAFKQDAHLFHIGYRVPMGVHTVTVSYNRLDDTTSRNADARSYGVAYTYSLSKRTDVSAVVARVDNSAQAQVLLGGNAYIGGFTQATGVDSNSLALSVRHRF